ncbi:MAG: hypothetical protein FD166_1807 [Bacteroidetes bacterium]|nr:MAG: hypothetical protein FD166_1807 [Bacteroidota bacterium]
MELFRDVLLIMLPALMTGTAVFFIIRHYNLLDKQKYERENLAERMRLVTPVRLQAYERMVLLLERMMPSQLIMRNVLPGTTASELQNSLVSNIRQEFDHNLSQQLYISSNAWSLIKNARESVISEINSAAEKLEQGATATDLAQLLFQAEMMNENSSLNKALEFLKTEARQLF